MPNGDDAGGLRVVLVGEHVHGKRNSNKRECQQSKLDGNINLNNYAADWQAWLAGSLLCTMFSIADLLILIRCAIVDCK